MKNKQLKIGASIDIETTGFKAGVQEIVEVSIILHDEKFMPKDSFTTKIRPMRPELAAPQAMIVNGLSLASLKTEATPAQVRNAFFQWHEEIAEGKTIIPLGHNFAFDQRFLEIFFGSFYNEIFYYKFRDTFVFAKGMKDSGLLETVQSLKLASMCKHFDIPHKAHSAYGDAMATLLLYRKLVSIVKEK